MIFIVATVLLLTEVSAYELTEIQLTDKDVTYVDKESRDFKRDVDLTSPVEASKLKKDLEEWASKMKFKRQTDPNCLDDTTFKYKNLTCLQLHVVLGWGACAGVGEDLLKAKCCKSNHDHCAICPDTSRILIKGQTCTKFMANTGSVFCDNPTIKKYCCGTRRIYCRTCYGDTRGGLKLAGHTCDAFLKSSEYGAKYCNNHQIIQHCCSTRAKHCPCEGDVNGALFNHRDAPGGTAPCSKIFSFGTIKDQCNHPNLWNYCCKTRQTYCNGYPAIHILGPEPPGRR